MSRSGRPARKGAEDQTLSLFESPDFGSSAASGRDTAGSSGGSKRDASASRSGDGSTKQDGASRRASTPASRTARGRVRDATLQPSQLSEELVPTPDRSAPPMPSWLAGDETPGSSASSAVSVASLTQTVKDVLEGAFLPLWVRGEVTDFKAHRNGHWYFCLRDEDAQVRCVVWARDQRRIPAPPDDGMQLAAFGQVTVWPGRGDLQLVIKAMEAQGDGLWRKALDLAIARLTSEGLLAPERKRALPRHPSRIAVVTSPDGAALHDIVAVARRRAPHVEIVVVPTRVQGDGAPEEICAALERLARWGDADLAIVGRGGGGREDLWAFNDERVARAVAAMPMPTISAVGHEVDVTLCDLVADLRAPTPSAAAEAAVPDMSVVRAELARWHRRLADSATWRVSAASERRLRVARRMGDAMARLTERRRSKVESAAARLHALSPLATLSRGYSLARDEHGRTLSAIVDFKPGAPFNLLVRDGVVAATAVEARPRDDSGGPLR